MQNGDVIANIGRVAKRCQALYDNSLCGLFNIIFLDIF